MQRTVQLTDPRALRALAHPIRLELFALLRRGGPLTATQAGQRLGESAASCSFHLRQLAKYGLVEEAGGGRGRERPWRPAARSIEWAARGRDDEADAAGAMLSRLVVERYFQWALDWLDRRATADPTWAEAADMSDAIVYMSPAELGEVVSGIRDLIEPYLKRVEDQDGPAEGTCALNVIGLAFPLPVEPREEG
jgi:DNA-binding transcriptional ArsR family regulator